MKALKVYGPGCAKCEDMAALVKDVSNELGLDVPVEKITDVMQFAVAGVIMTPALAVDGKIVVSGRVPSRDEMRELLQISGNSAEPGREQPLAEKEPESGSCGCGSGACCSEGKSPGGIPGKGSFWRNLTVWIVIILVAISVIKLANRKAREAEAGVETSLSTEGAAVKDDRVELVYYQYGARCPSCVRMEKWVGEAMAGAFKNEMDQGLVVWRSIPADERTVRDYGLTTKSILIKSFKGGVETGWKTMDKIWDLNSSEGEFKQYLEQGVREALKAI